MENALAGTGRKVLFIRDNKVIGEGSCVIQRGDEWCGIHITSGELVGEVKDLEPFKSMGMTHTYVRFSPFSGSYIGCGFTDEPLVDTVLQNVRAVDKFYLSFGFVPDDFKSVEGYRSEIASDD